MLGYVDGDIFLGRLPATWAYETPRDYYVPQLSDWNLGAEVETMLRPGRRCTARCAAGRSHAPHALAQAAARRRDASAENALLAELRSLRGELAEVRAELLALAPPSKGPSETRPTGTAVNGIAQRSLGCATPVRSGRRSGGAARRVGVRISTRHGYARLLARRRL
jgi:hypothetical protein